MKIRHVVLFKLKPGHDWSQERVLDAELLSTAVGERVPEVEYWYCGRNFSTRDVAYDYVVMAVLDGRDSLERYLQHPFHQRAIQAWRAISTWVVVDVEEDSAYRFDSRQSARAARMT